MTATSTLVTGGVDTHLDVHVASVLDHLGGVLGTASFSTTATGYAQLFSWLEEHGTVEQVGVEGTGSYGAGLTRYLRSHGGGGVPFSLVSLTTGLVLALFGKWSLRQVWILVKLGLQLSILATGALFIGPILMNAPHQPDPGQSEQRFLVLLAAVRSSATMRLRRGE